MTYRAWQLLQRALAERVLRILFLATAALMVLGFFVAGQPLAGSGGGGSGLVLSLVLLIAIWRASKLAWYLLSMVTAFWAIVFLLDAIGPPFGWQLGFGLVLAAQLDLLLSRPVRRHAGVFAPATGKT